MARSSSRPAEPSVGQLAAVWQRCEHATLEALLASIVSTVTEIAEFSFSYDRVVRWLLPRGRRARVEVSDHDFYVHFGRGFESRFPLSSIRQIGHMPKEWVNMNRGVHGGHGAWLVNGSRRGLVRLILEPPIWARTSVGPAKVGVEVRELRLSLEDPDGLIQRVRAVTEASS